MKKIIIIGAGIGGLYLASLLGKEYDVVLYEKKNRSQLGYPWFDAVDKDTLKKYDIRLRSTAIYPKQVLSLHGPSGEGILKQKENRSNNLDIDRRALIRALLRKAEKTTTVHYNTAPTELIIENGAVVGVQIGATKDFCDLVVDSSGMFSPFKNSPTLLTKDTLHSYDSLTAYRATYKKTDKQERPSNVYLMPENLALVWCKDAREEGLSDVFISKFGKLCTDDIQRGIKYIQQENDILDKEHIQGVVDSIPIRPPTAIPVANGYALVGNSAFLTKPLSGSGIENALFSAQLLYKTIKKCKNFDAKSLWQYAFQLNVVIGSNYYFICILRSLLPKLSQEELIWIFNSGVLTLITDYIRNIDILKIKSFPIEELTGKLKDIIQKKDLLEKVLYITKKAVYGKLLSSSLLPVYDKRILTQWKKKYDEYWEEVNLPTTF